VGVVSTDHFFTPCPTVRRALGVARAALEQAGHECVVVDLPLTGWETARLYYGIMGSDGDMHGIVAGLEGEPLLPTYASLKRLASIPNWVRPAAMRVLRAMGEERLAWVGAKVRGGPSRTALHTYIHASFAPRAGAAGLPPVV
jgi:fatty acid amide hydrolase